MGDRLPRYLATGNDLASGARIRRWREREGVDLGLDVWRGGGWTRVAVVPTVGPVAMRTWPSRSRRRTAVSASA